MNRRSTAHREPFLLHCSTRKRLSKQNPAATCRAPRRLMRKPRPLRNLLPGACRPRVPGRPFGALGVVGETREGGELDDGAFFGRACEFAGGNPRAADRAAQFVADRRD